MNWRIDLSFHLSRQTIDKKDVFDQGIRYHRNTLTTGQSTDTLSFD